MPGNPASVTATGQKAANCWGWVPQRNDLTTIVETAFAWERHLELRKSWSADTGRRI